MTTRKGSKRPFILVTVSGGCATVWEPPGVESEIVDWDNWDQQIPTQNDIDQLREIAKKLSPHDRPTFLKHVEELAEKIDLSEAGVSGSELKSMTEVEMEDKAKRRLAAEQKKG